MVAVEGEVVYGHDYSGHEEGGEEGDGDSHGLVEE